ncbi:hypothetical protein H4R23_004184, partial [Coemansia sp. Cherry 401B]
QFAAAVACGVHAGAAASHWPCECRRLGSRAPGPGSSGKVHAGAGAGRRSWSRLRAAGDRCSHPARGWI